jgi:hypothetical protein
MKANSSLTSLQRMLAAFGHEEIARPVASCFTKGCGPEPGLPAFHTDTIGIGPGGIRPAASPPARLDYRQLPPARSAGQLPSLGSGPGMDGNPAR